MPANMQLIVWPKVGIRTGRDKAMAESIVCVNEERVRLSKLIVQMTKDWLAFWLPCSITTKLWLW